MSVNSPEEGIDVINACNDYQEILLNAYVISVNVYYFNKRQMKCRKSFVVWTLNLTNLDIWKFTKQNS